MLNTRNVGGGTRANGDLRGTAQRLAQRMKMEKKQKKTENKRKLLQMAG